MPETRKTIGKFMTGINECFLIVLFISIIAVLTLQVFCRTFLSTSFPWAEEVSRYLFVYCVFGGASLAFNKGLFICVDVVSKLLPGGVKFIVSALILVVILSFFLVISYLGIELVIGSAGQLTPALEIEIRYVYLAIPIFFLQMSFFAARKLVLLFKTRA